MRRLNFILFAMSSALPRWNLERHFERTDIFDLKLDDDVESFRKDAENFQQEYESRLSKSPNVFLQAILDYEAITVKVGNLSAFVYLSFSTQQDNAEAAKRQSALSASMSAIESNYLTFFTLEVADLEQEVVESFLSSEVELAGKRLAHFRPFVMNIRKRQPHLLSKNVERALSLRGPWVGSSPVVEWYDKILSTADMEYDGQKMPMESLLSKTMNADPAVRRDALKALNNGLRSNRIDEFAALSLNVVTGKWHIEKEERKYQTLRSSRNLDNDVDDDTVVALLKAVRSKGVELCKRYYKLKKSILKKTQNVDKFTWADRNAPLGFERKEGPEFTWSEAVEIVREGYQAFSPKFRELFDQMVAEERIDAPIQKGKRGGAFCHPVTPKIGPFQLLNFDGSSRDVSTLAHESGHGCHFYLAYAVGPLLMDTPLTLAEVASTFGEMVVFRSMLAKKSKEDRLAMLMQKVDDIVNTVVRQCSFDFFEEKAHTARVDGRVGTEQYSEMWMEATKLYYGEEGEVFDAYEDMELLWSYVGHFHHVPFYVYAYAFADLVVGSLYSVYLKEKTGFEPKLLEFLSAGGSKNFQELLQPFGLDPTDESFWVTALETHLETLLEETESLARELSFV